MLLSIADFDLPAGLFKALAHPARLAILTALGEGEACVCHLQAVLGLRQAYLSQQLISLREAGLVTDRRVGSNVYYRVCDPRHLGVLRVVGITPRPGDDPLATCACPRCQAARDRATRKSQVVRLHQGERHA